MDDMTAAKSEAKQGETLGFTCETDSRLVENVYQLDLNTAAPSPDY